jgi:hypothetical protein
MLDPPVFRPFGSKLAVQGRYNQNLFHRVLSRSLQGIAERPLPCNYNVIQPVAGAVIVLARRSVYDLPTILICAVSLAVLFRWKIPEPVLIACAAVAGLVLRHA